MEEMFKKECSKQYRNVKFKSTTTKWPYKKKPTEQHNNT